MCIQIKLDNGACFTQEIINSLEDCYENLGLDKHVFECIKNKVSNGKIEPLINEQSKDNRECHLIYLNCTNIGYIMLIRYESDHNLWEIDILLYNNYRGKHKSYAKKSLRQLICKYSNRKWVARILITNQYFDQIKKILQELGFKKHDDGVPNSEGIIVHEFNFP